MNILNDRDNVILTSLTRKITLNGVTKIYPVYKINLSRLYYNDQNDRIASWISQYKEENGHLSLYDLPREEYNNVIEKFIVSSNPTSIEKTQMNIELVGQREPGVVLADGRVIDGNRRYTCLRRLNKKNPKNCWFEAVILDVDLNDSRKMIKMLELTIQHGEEKRVDYNHVERLIGVYQDIVETKLLTEQEYALSTNESIHEVRKKIEASKILVGFLDYIGMPKQYHIAREFQIVSLINDLPDLFKKCIERNQIDGLVKIVYLNILMNTIGEERKFVKNLSSLLLNGTYYNYALEQEKIEVEVLKRLALTNPKNSYDLRTFVRNNSDLSDELLFSLDDALKGAKRNELFSRPTQVVAKTITSIRDIDINVVSKMSTLDKERIRTQIKFLNNAISKIDDVVNDEPKKEVKTETPIEVQTIKKVNPVKTENILEEKKYEIIPSKFDELVDFEIKNKNTITTLCYGIKAKLMYGNDLLYKMFFIDKEYKVCSDIVEVNLTNEYKLLTFNLNGRISSEKSCYLVIQKDKDKENQARFMLEFKVNVAFGSDIDF